MPPRRFPIGVLLPIGLALLVAALATLQYRWVGQVSDADRADLQASLQRRAEAFVKDFDGEIDRLSTALRGAARSPTPAGSNGLTASLEVWRATTRFPHLVQGIYRATRTADHVQVDLEEYSALARGFEAVPWPAALAPLRERLGTTPRDLPVGAAGARTEADAVRQTQTGTTPRPQFRAMTAPDATSVANDIPALVVSISHLLVGGRGGGNDPGFTLSMTMLRPANSQFVIAQLDRVYLQQVVLPALAREHLGSRVRSRVVDASRSVVFADGVLPGSDLDAPSADVTTAFFGPRPDSSSTVDVNVSRSPVPTDRVTIGQDAAVPQNFLYFVERHVTTSRLSPVAGAWLLFLQDDAGSVGAAVAAARRRNLWLSFGILGVLTAGIALVTVNARRSERLAAQQLDFVATVSHELRTPIAVMRSAAQNLAAGVVHDKEDARQYGDLIEREGHRLTGMVEQVLEYARLSDRGQPSQSRPGDLRALVRNVISACAPLLEAASMEVDLDVAEDVPPAMMDEDAISRAVHNLVTNALKHAAGGGWIGVTVRRAADADTPQVEIAVRDRGPGVDPADVAHIFEPFYRGRSTAERQIPGSGLGLSLVKRIADAHGGRLAVESRLGQGATFTLRLPALSEPS